MPCLSLTALPRACADGVIAGLEKVYIIAFKDLAPINTGTTAVFSASTTGVVNVVTRLATKTFVEIGLLKSTSGLNEKLTKDDSKGVSFFEQSFTLVLGDITVDNQTFIKNVTNQPVVVIYKTRTGKHFIAGLNGQFEVSAIEGGTGTAEADLIGYTLTFNGNSTTVAPFILDSLVPTLLV